MDKDHASDELDDYCRSCEKIVGEDDSAGGKIYFFYIALAIGHEHMKCAAYPRTKEDGCAYDMNPFDEQITHSAYPLHDQD